MNLSLMKGLRTLAAVFLLTFAWSAIPCAARGVKPSLSKEDVVQIADDAARKDGIDLRNFGPPKAFYEFTRKDGTWTVFYEGIVLNFGNHFLVTIDDTTKHADIAGGM